MTMLVDRSDWIAESVHVQNRHFEITPVGTVGLTLFALMSIRWILEKGQIIFSGISNMTSKTDHCFDLRWSLTAE